MNIEQAKALKVGDDIVRTFKDTYSTVGKTYTVRVVGSHIIGWYDDSGELKNSLFGVISDRFDLPTTTPTQWIPFDKERMSEAEGYRNSARDKLVEVTLFSNGEVISINDTSGVFVPFNSASNKIEMLVPVVVKYPCLMMVIDCDGGSSLQKITGTDGLSYIGDCGTIYSSARAPTTAELAEIGLKQIS